MRPVAQNQVPHLCLNAKMQGFVETSIGDGPGWALCVGKISGNVGALTDTRTGPDNH